MAGDWIKMRGELCTHPKVLRMAAILGSSKAIGKRLSTGFNGALDEIVTRDVTRDVTLASLLRVWCAANCHTVTGVWLDADLEMLDQIAGVPGFGDAMVEVGWAVFDAERGEVTFPNFLEYNVPAKNGRRSSAAERQRKYRERLKGLPRDARDVTRYAEVEVELEKNVTPTPSTRSARARTEGLEGRAGQEQHHPEKVQAKSKNGRGAQSAQDASAAPEIGKGSSDPAKVAHIQTWRAYAVAFRARYHADPVRNARVNGLIVGFVARVGRSDAPAIAAYYVDHNHRYYIEKMHPVSLLVADAEKLSVEWRSGVQVTASSALQQDRTEANRGVFQKLLEEEERREREQSQLMAGSST